MSRFNPLLWTEPNAIRKYGIAVLSVTTALILAQWPVLHLGAAPVSLFLCAVMLSAWFGGLAPGLLATVLSDLAFYYYFLPPEHSLGAKPHEIPRFIAFTLSKLVVALLASAQRSATESLRGARDDLKVTVQELQRANEALRAESIERRHAEDKLRQSEAYLHEAQTLGRMGSWAHNISSGTFYASPELLRILGRDPQEKNTTSEILRASIHPEDRRFYVEMVTRAMSEKTDFESNYRIVHPDGPIKHVHSVGRACFDDSGDVVEYIGTIMDVTESKRAEEALRQTQADLARVSRITTMGELTASLAHEINQPIAAAITDANTCLRWLAGDVPNLEEAREAAARVVKDSRRASEIVSRTRLLFKKGTSERELVDVNAVVREMIVLLNGELTRYSISVQMELAADLPQVFGDRVQLQQVIMNLVMNSIDAMKDVDRPRKLAIRSERVENEQLMVSITDNGVGLPMQAEQIFNAFFTTKAHGTGMGLSISRSIVESHGGRLWGAGNSSHGASFHLTLPIKVEAHE